LHIKSGHKARPLKPNSIVARSKKSLQPTGSSSFQSNNLNPTTTVYLEKGTELFHGAGNGARTRDTKLGKLVLYQLSYARSSFLY
jgi:hypothetical protein